ncbi:TPA: DNA polymerase I [bacterium]|nr:DNA polymerase I [bacterium]
MRKLFLLDGHSLAYRAFYAIPPLTNSKGQQTNAIYGFCNMLLKIIKEESPDYLCVCFDSSVPTFRHNIFPKYKAHRERMPQEMRDQMLWIVEVIENLGCSSISVDGYEADDVMATIARRFKLFVDKIFLITQDKDIFQLIDDKINVVSCKKGISERITYDSEKTKERFGVLPEKIVDFLSLVGDTSDNLPGAKGLGEKQAQKFVNEYNLSEIIKDPSIIKDQKLYKIILDEKENIELTKDLVILKDAPIDISLDSLKIKPQNKEKLLSIFLELEFRSLISQLGLSFEKKEESIGFSYQAISQKNAISMFLKDNKKIFFSDGELIWSCSNPNEAEGIFENEGIEKIGYDLKAWMIFLSSYDIKLYGKLFDIMIGSYLLGHGLKQTIDDVFIRHNPGASVDAKTIFKTKENIEKKLIEDGLLPLFYDLEMPLVNVLFSMEKEGIKIDKSYLEQLGIELERKLFSLTHEIYKSAQTEFNINSPKQLSFVLFEKLCLPIIKKGKTGPSTDEETLAVLSKLHPLPNIILEYRELAKLKSTYIDGLIPLIGKDGRIHSVFNQAITATGRLSSSNPNLQNIPVRTEIGRLIRKAFIPEEGKIFLSADYSQIELRLLAHISGDELLIKAFNNNEDIHKNTASKIYGVMPELVTEDMRRQAKIINFGIIYGMSGYGLSKELGITPNEAQMIIDRYFEMHKGIEKYIKETLKKAKEKGYVETLWERKRYIPEIFSKNKQVKEFGERAAINMPIQGTCADLIKKAMIKIYERLPDDCKMILQVHDELLFEMPKERVSEVTPVILEAMKNAGKFDVPIVVNISSGKNWGEMTAN